MNITLEAVEAVILAYLLGSIPFSWLAGKLFRGIDIRKHGSGNAGATNVWRVMGPAYGLAVGLLDLGKGWLAVAAAGMIVQDTTRTSLITIEVLSGFAAVAGHSWPLWLGFRGGKGVLTAGGAFLYLAWLPMACSMAVFILVFAVSRYVSLGSMVAAACLPFFIVLIRGPWHRWQILAISIVVAAVIIFRHSTNIHRLLKGTEHSFSKKPPARKRKKGGRRK